MFRISECASAGGCSHCHGNHCQGVWSSTYHGEYFRVCSASYKPELAAHLEGVLFHSLLQNCHDIFHVQLCDGVPEHLPISVCYSGISSLFHLHSLLEQLSLCPSE